MSSSDEKDVSFQIVKGNVVNAQLSSHQSTADNEKDLPFPPPPIKSTIHTEDDVGHQPDIPQVPSSFVIEDCSIYDMYTSLRCRVILGTVALAAFLLPFCDTIYLPALNVIRKDLNTTHMLVALTVSIYLIMNGIFSLAWGPIADRFGRKISLIAALIIFVAASIVCVFAPNIAVLLVFRVLQGSSVSATMVVGQAVISDIYSEKKRALATGLFFVPFLVGPVIGPLIGGVLSEALDWRSTFVLLSIISFIVLIIVFFLIPETHQYFSKRSFEKANPNKRIIEVTSNEKPSIKHPWKPLILLLDLAILPYVIMTTATFMALFVTLTLFPNHLEKDPYNYQEILIGVLYIPSGFTMLVGSLIGGRLSDKFGKHFGNQKCPEGRLIPSVLFASLVPIGLLLYGWMLHINANVAGPILGQILISFSRASLLPGVFAYLTIKKQKNAAGVVSANTFLNFIGAGVGVAVAIPMQDAMGVGPVFSLYSSINVISIAVASILIYIKVRQASQVVTQDSNVLPESLKPEETAATSTNGNLAIKAND